MHTVFDTQSHRKDIRRHHCYAEKRLCSLLKLPASSTDVIAYSRSMLPANVLESTMLGFVLVWLVLLSSRARVVLAIEQLHRYTVVLGSSINHSSTDHVSS